MPKGASAADDLAVRLSWPHPATPLPPGTAGANEPPAKGTSNGASNGIPAEGLALVIQRLDALTAEVASLGQHFESLALAMAQQMAVAGPPPAKPADGASSAVDTPSPSPAGATARRSGTRRRATA